MAGEAFHDTFEPRNQLVYPVIGLIGCGTKVTIYLEPTSFMVTPGALLQMVLTGQSLVCNPLVSLTFNQSLVSTRPDKNPLKLPRCWSPSANGSHQIIQDSFSCK